MATERTDKWNNIIETLPIDYKDVATSYQIFLQQHEALVRASERAKNMRSSEGALEVSRAGEDVSRRLFNLTDIVKEVRGDRDGGYFVVEGTERQGYQLAYFLGSEGITQGMYEISTKQESFSRRILSKIVSQLEPIQVQRKEIGSYWKRDPEIMQSTAEGLIKMLPNNSAAKTILSLGN